VPLASDDSVHLSTSFPSELPDGGPATSREVAGPPSGSNWGLVLFGGVLVLVRLVLDLEFRGFEAEDLAVVLVDRGGHRGLEHVCGQLLLDDERILRQV